MASSKRLSMSAPLFEIPSRREEERFEETGAACEWAELYCPGGFHPVHLGDSFQNGRYRITRKLGDGSFATVWLAFDRINSRYVALKIMMAKSSASADLELQICSRLAGVANDDPSSAYIMMLLESFEHEGPNGKHRCLVYEPMASTVASMRSKLPWKPQRTFPPNKARYPKWMAKKILKTALSGLSFLHKHGVVHGDFQPGNLLISLRQDLSSVDETELLQDKSKITEPLRRLDGKPDRWAPRYLIIGESLHKYADLTPNMSVKISDFGAAFWSKNPPKSTVTPLALRAPELIFNESFDWSIDIWSFGCLVYELLTGQQLFGVFALADDEKDDADDDMDSVNEEEDDIPREDYHTVPGDYNEEDDDHSDKDHAQIPGEYNEEENTENPSFKKFRPPSSNGPMVINDSLETLFDKHKPGDIDSEEAKVITGLIRKILRYEPSERPTASELLRHEWFQDRLA